MHPQAKFFFDDLTHCGLRRKFLQTLGYEVVDVHEAAMFAKLHFF
jgi:hypothetical protein